MFQVKFYTKNELFLIIIIIIIIIIIAIIIIISIVIIIKLIIKIITCYPKHIFLFYLALYLLDF